VNDVTQLLGRIEQGDPKAAADLLPLVYDELRRLATHKMAHESPGQTLQPTALVHEAWLRLAASTDQQWSNRRHFFAAAAEAMRRILIDNARRKNRVRHGGELVRVDLDQVDVAVNADGDTLTAIHEAIENFSKEDPVKAELVKLRFFLGLSICDAGKALGLSESTAKRYWNYARAWLYDALTNRKIVSEN